MVKASRQNYDREYVGNLNQDHHRNISNVGRQTLLTLGRWLFWNFPALRGAILEQANLAVGSFIPQYAGANKEWGTLAEQWLKEWHRIMDVASGPYDYDTYKQNLIVAPMVDGDTGTLLTETPDGYPQIQVIPSHRIGCSDSIVDSGPYAGMAVVDGCICGELGNVVAYRLKQGDGWRDVPVASMFLTFTPSQTGQVRGPSDLASSAFDWQDTAEIRRFEMLAQKAFASQTIIETNETGDADEAQKIISGAATFNANGTAKAPAVQQLDGGTYRYLKAGSGSKLEAFDWNRPNQNAQSFMETIIRDAFRGAEMDSLFSLDPKSVGGGPMRIIVERVNATLNKRRKQVEKACRRVDGYAVAKAMKLGLLPFDADWWRWEYQGPGDVTADRKYDSDVDLQEISSGLATRKSGIARRGQYIEEVDAQREVEVDSDLTRAQRLATKHGITIMESMVCLRPPTPQQQLPQQQQTGGPQQ